MATTSIILKRYNGTDWDTLNPATTQAQVSGLVTALSNKLETSLKGTANGLAELDTNGKVPETQLPGSVFGGMRFVGAIGASATTSTLYTTLDTYISNNGGVFEGLYFVSTGTYTITMSAGDAVLNNEEGSGTPTSADLEAGDWLLIRNADGTTANAGLDFAVINNTYSNASTSVKGVVELATQAEVDAGTAGVVVTADTLADRLADFSLITHNHAGVYLGVNDNAVSATKLQTSRTISLTGDVTGSVGFDGTANVSITAVVGNDTHQHNTTSSLYNTSAGLNYGTGVGTLLSGTIEGIDTELYARQKITYALSAPTIDVRTNDIWIDA